jgi:hypothetical protein
MDNTSMFLSAINDKYPSTQDYPDFVVKSLEGIHQRVIAYTSFRINLIIEMSDNL